MREGRAVGDEVREAEIELQGLKVFSSVASTQYVLYNLSLLLRAHLATDNMSGRRERRPVRES